MSYEQLREQCAKLAESSDKSTHPANIADAIRALPLPEVMQKPIAWLRKDTMQKLIDKPSGTAGFGATLFFNETALHTEPLYVLPLPEVSDKPVAYMRNRFAQSLDTNGHCDGHEWLEVCSEDEQGDDGEPAFPVYATPRPYIPQDIREAVEENEALRKENAKLNALLLAINDQLMQAFSEKENLLNQIAALKGGAA